MHIFLALFVIVFFGGGILLCAHFYLIKHRIREFVRQIPLLGKTVGFEGRRYYVDRKDKNRINSRKAVLFIKRQYRRFREVFVKDNVAYLVMIVAWCVFVLISFLWGKSYYVAEDEPYYIIDVLWDLKNSIFTSVVLALVISAVNRVREHRKIISAQHYTYVTVMRTFEQLFKRFIGDNICYYMPLYCRECLDDTLLYISQEYYQDGMSVENTEEYRNVLEEIRNHIDLIEKELQYGHIYGGETGYVDYAIKKAKKELNTLYSEELISFEILSWLGAHLLEIVNSIRAPWRWDIETKIEILKILDAYPENDISEDFYYSMLLYGHTLTEVDIKAEVEKELASLKETIFG